MMTNGMTQIKQQAKKPIVVDSEMPTIKATKDYSRFKVIKGNRRIYVHHVNNLTKRVAQQNLLAQNPILVNKNMEVIDGQHRLEVAKNNNLTIYYIVVEPGDLTLVQRLNTSTQPWKGMDYLESYLTLGKPAYKTIKYYMDAYKLSLNVVLFLVRPGAKYSAWSDFKRGEIEINDEAELQMRVEAYMKIRPYIRTPAWKDKQFIRAFVKLIQEKPVEDLIVNFERSGWIIEQQVLEKDYLREFERVLNYRKQNTIRLF